MSEHGFQVHEPHDLALENAAEGHGNNFTNKAGAEKLEAQATTAFQVPIALAAIALLTRKVWLEYAMFGMLALGIGVGVLAALHI